MRYRLCISHHPAVRNFTQDRGQQGHVEVNRAEQPGLKEQDKCNTQSTATHRPPRTWIPAISSVSCMQISRVSRRSSRAKPSSVVLIVTRESCETEWDRISSWSLRHAFTITISRQVSCSHNKKCHRTSHPTSDDAASKSKENRAERLRMDADPMDDARLKYRPVQRDCQRRLDRTTAMELLRACSMREGEQGTEKLHRSA